MEEVDDIVDFIDSSLTEEEQTVAIDKWVDTAIKQELGVDSKGKMQSLEKLEKENFLWLLRVFKNKLAVSFYKRNQENLKERQALLTSEGATGDAYWKKTIEHAKVMVASQEEPTD